MTQVLLDSRRRSIVVSAALALSLVVQGCTVLDDDYTPNLIQSPEPAELPSSIAELGEESATEAPDTADLQEPSDDEASPSAELFDEAEGAAPVGAEEAQVASALPDAREPVSPATPSIDAEPGALDSPVAFNPLDAPGSVCANGFGAFGAPERVDIQGLDAEIRGPSITSDGAILYFSATVGGVISIYEAERASAESAVFGSVASVSELESAGRNGTPFISLDRQRLYFYSTRDDATDLDLWLAVREPETDRFAAPAPLLELNTSAYDLLPWATPDDLMIAFVSSRPTRAGSSDIWYAERASRDVPFDAPAPAVELNTDGNEGRVALSADGLTVFFSSDRGGSPDLFTASRLDRGQPFATPVAIESLNSPSTDHDVALSADGRELFFASTRDGSSAIWRALRPCA